MRKITFTENGAVVLDGRIAGLVPTDLTHEEVASLLYEAQTTIVRASVSGQAKGELDASARLRDQFAMAALAAIPHGDYHIGSLIDCDEIARDAYGIADAMIAVRSEGGEL